MWDSEAHENNKRAKNNHENEENIGSSSKENRHCQKYSLDTWRTEQKKGKEINGINK